MKAMKISAVSFAVCFILLGFHSFASAETEYVDECLEQPEHCEESLFEENEANHTEPQEQEETGSLFFELVRVFFALLLVLGIIYTFLYFLRRKNKFGNRIQMLENIGGISVGQNKSVQIVRLGDRLYLIGVGENITLLEEIEDETLLEEVMKQREEQSELNAGDLFSSILPKRKSEEATQANKFNSLFQQELNRLQTNRKTIIDRHKEDKDE